MYGVSASNPQFVIKNKSTGLLSVTQTFGVPHTVVSPGTAAQWVLPNQKELGEIRTGEVMTFTLPGPEGAAGQVRGLSITGDREIFRVNGCGTGCSAGISDGDQMTITTHAENGTPEGEYGLNVEATLLCD